MAYERESKESRALTQIDSSRYPDTNRDFVRNIRRLNQDVDYISGYMRIMQKGIDDASKNFIEQIQSFINDLIVLFAGGEPTGIELGDLKYIIQGLGALFGFGQGPFPLNLLNAAQHFFFGYVVPLPQFTDLIFDSIFAWMAEFGFSEEAIAVLRDFASAFEDLAVDIGDLFTTILGVFDIFGILAEDGSLSLDAFSPLWDLIATFFDALNVAVLRPIVDVISTWTVPFVTALTQVITVIDNIIETLFGDFVFEDMYGVDFNVITLISALIENLISNGLLGGLDLSGFLGVDSPLNALNLFNIGGILGKVSIGNLTTDTQELLDSPDFKDAISIQGGGIWEWDGTVGKTTTGSAKVVPNSSLLQLMSNTIAVGEGDEVDPSVWAKWSGLTYTGTSPIKIQVVELLYDSVTENFATMGTQNISATATPGTNQATWIELTSPYTVPANVSHITLQIAVESTATGGTVWFDDASVKKTGLIQMPWVSGLSGALATIQSFAQGIIDTFLGAWGISGSGFDLTDLFNIASAIPSLNVLGFNGSNNIGQNIQDLLDVGIQAILGGTSTGYSFFDWGDALTQIPPTNVTGAGGLPNVLQTFGTMWDLVTSALRLSGLSGVSINDFADAAQDTSFGALNANILAGGHEATLGTRTNNPIDGALERTAVSNFPWTLLGTSATPANFAVTQSASAVGIIRMPNTDTKGTIFWRSIYTGTITGFYVNVGKINDVTGAVDHLYQTPNLASSLTTTWSWDYYQPPAIDRITHGIDDGLVVEFQVVGSGTVSIAGQDFQWQTDNFPGAITKRSAASRNTAGSHPDLTLSGAAMTSMFTTRTPWVALGRADTPITYHPPEPWNTTVAGAFTYTIPVWARVAGTIIDYWALGGGGGGQSGGYFAVLEGGRRGNWVKGSFVYGTDIPLGTTTLTGVVADNASGGLNPFLLQPGDNGNSTTITGIGGGFTTKTATGGLGGGQSGNAWNQAGGEAATNETIAGYTAFGGAAAGVNQPGNNPGGGGGSGYPAVGRDGAEGRVWFRARQP